MSLSRFQWLLWFLVLFSAYFTGSVGDVAYGGDLPAIEPDLFGLIGITTGSAVISNVVVDTKKRAPDPKAAEGNAPLVSVIDVNTSPAQAAWEDLYLGEEAANRATVDDSRLQKVVITLLLVIVYMQMLWSAFVEASLTYHAFVMPSVGTNFLVMLGASHAAYLAYKATNKSSPSPTPAP